MENLAASNSILRFQPYLVVFSQHRDLSVQRGKFGEPTGPLNIGDELRRRFTTACVRYRGRLERNADRFLNPRTTASEPDRWDPFADPFAEGRRFHEYLYNPACWLTFGYADLLSMVIIDDFDPFLRVTSEVGLPLENTNLCFVPDLDCLGLKQMVEDSKIQDIAGSDWKDPICDLLKLLDGVPLLAQPEEPRERNARDPLAWRPAVHGFQKLNPLVLFTEFRVAALASIGPSLRFRRALLRAMAKRVLKVQTNLFEGLRRVEGLPPEQIPPSLKPLVELEMVHEDVRDLQVSFLELQGASDIGLLISSRNYSLAASIVQALDALTFKDLFDDRELQGTRLRESVVRDDSPRAQILRVANADSKSMAKYEHLDSNHVFTSTYSVLGVNHETFLSRDLDGCRGYVEIYPRLNVSPGHFPDLKKVVKYAYGPSAGSPQPGIKRLTPPEHYHRILIGRYDYDCAATTEAGEQSVYPAIHVKDGFRSLRRFLEQLKAEAGEKRLRGETGFAGSATGFVVPIPNFAETDLAFWPPFDLKTHVPMVKVQEDLSNKLIRTNGSRTEAGASPPARERAWIDVGALGDAMRELSLPVSLQWTVGYLFQTFRRCVQKPELFEGVVDLYDAFKTLEVLIWGFRDRKRPEPWPPAQGHRVPATLLLSAKEVEDLAQILESLQSTLAYHLHLRVDREIADLGAGFRGGLNGLMGSVDSLLKSSVGLVKWLFYGPGSGQEGVRPPIPPVAGISRYSFHSHWQCCSMCLRPDDALGPVVFALLEMNVGHFFHPAVFTFYIHEAAHVLLEAQGVEDEPPDKELFAEMVTLLFVFGGDAWLYERYIIARWSQDPRALEVQQPESGEAPEEVIIARFFAVLLRYFLVTRPVLLLAGHDMSRTASPRVDPDSLLAWGEHPWGDRRPCDASWESFLGQAADEFRAFVNRVGPFFSQFNRLWNGADAEDVRALCDELFHREFVPSVVKAEAAWKRALDTYKQFARSAFSWNAPARNGRGSLRKLVREAFESGETAIYDLLLDRLAEAEASGAPKAESQKYSELALLCDLIYCYVDFCYGGLDTTKGLHVLRDKAGDIEYPPDGGGHFKGWNSYQFDPRYVGQICPDPQLRRDRLARKLVVLRCLGDLSARQKERRLARMVEGCFPSGEAQPGPRPIETQSSSA